jgi:hypothetical protein
VDRINAVAGPLHSVLIPLLGTGTGGGDPGATVAALAGAIVDYFTQTQPAASDGRQFVSDVYLLAYSEAELLLLRNALEQHPRLVGESSSL